MYQKYHTQYRNNKIFDFVQGYKFLVNTDLTYDNTTLKKSLLYLCTGH